MPRSLRSPASVAAVVGLALVVLGLVAFVAVYDWVQNREDLARYDQPILDALVAVRSAPTTAILTTVTTVSGPVVLPMLVALGALLWGFRGRQWWSAGLLVGAMVVAVGSSTVIKIAVGRARPDQTLWVVPGAESSASFPSGHTIGAATFLLVLGYLAWVRNPTWRTATAWLVAAVLGMALVAFSRLYLGYHFATDTVASMALALAVLGGVVMLDRRRAAGAARATVGRD
ncbi:phosphatase PAP2 family protein [Actinotalea lenta]|uniref:phosphatase PAP2 family protein n=1 Tax=Actinotalea lenta TaxID=3064654 RepID=UPI002729E2C0|nr:phosphatase PAP2 family protein [Isoptericola sp. b490]